MDKVHVLQLGREDWNGVYELPEGISLDYKETFTKPPEKQYDLFFLDRSPLEEEIGPLYHAVKAYTLFVIEGVELSGRAAWLCKSRKAQYLASADIQRFLLQEARFFYPRPYGDKIRLKDIGVAQGFSGAVKWNGAFSVELSGEFGEDFHQAVFWRYNTPLSKGDTIDLWLEYRKTPGVSISLAVMQFAAGSTDGIVGQWEFNEEELSWQVRLEAKRESGSLAFSLRARGKGKLELIALHKRFSRGSHGCFLPGGERYATSGREEVFSYFEPCDMKPPLNVYFSGYKTQEGFEGYYMMKSMGCPFLLLSEPRMEGGGFYMGSGEYEKLIISIIKKYMMELGIRPDQMILSGLSMGSFGALYYGCDLRPHAMILGKPLASIGNVAANEKYLRPGGFPTALDVLRYLCGSLDERAVKRLNDRFWHKFDSADWGNSKFIVSYMIEDDYDPDAYDSLLSHLRSSGVQVYGKGNHGRHNDNTDAIVSWFITQFKKILWEDFGRRIEK